MGRGDLLTLASQREQGRPRPALVVRADHLAGLADVTVLPITGAPPDARISRIGAGPAARNGLTKRSQVMVDKPQTPRRAEVGAVIGRPGDATLLAVNRALALLLGLG